MLPIPRFAILLLFYLSLNVPAGAAEADKKKAPEMAPETLAHLQETYPKEWQGVIEQFNMNAQGLDSAQNEKIINMFTYSVPLNREKLRELVPQMTREEKMAFGMKFGPLITRIDRLRDQHAKEQEGSHPRKGEEQAKPPGVLDPVYEEWKKSDETPAPAEEQAKYKAERGDTRGTILVANQAVERGSQNPETFLLRGSAFEKLGDHEAAHRDAARVLQVQPHNMKAVSLYKLTQGKASQIHFDMRDRSFTGERVDREDSVGRADTAADPADPAEDAQRELEVKAASKISGSADLTREARLAVRVKDYETAVKRAEAAVSLDPENAQAYQILASVMIKRKDFSTARGYASKGLAAAPENVLLYNTRSMAANRGGDYEAGLRDASAAIALSPKAGLGYFNRAQAQAGLGRGADARADLEKAAELSPHFERKLRQAQGLSDEELAAIFEDLTSGNPAAITPLKTPAPRASWPFRLFTIIGGLLIAFGLVHAVTRPGGRLATLFTRRDPSNDEDAIPDSGFWRRYDVLREIAAGGMGIVYEANDRSLGRRVAIKRMRDEFAGDRRERKRFLNEARIVAGVRHPNIIEIFSIEEEGEDAYLVFEYVDGKTLGEILQDKKRMSYAGSVEILRGVCEALTFAHTRGIVHRDLKPANIMVNRDGVSKVMDFGVARRSEGGPREIQETNTVIGTLPYMAPEQEEGIVRPEGDIFSLGVCLYELLTGTLPFYGTPGAVLLNKREGKYARLSEFGDGFPEDISRVVDRALSPDPEARFRTPMEFFGALERAVSARP